MNNFYRILTAIFLLIILYTPHMTGKELELLTPGRVEIADIKAGDTIYYVIQIRNNSDNPLEIYKVKSSCRCTILDFEPQIVQPQNNLDIKIAIDTRGMKGRVTRSVTIYSNDSDKPRTPVFFDMTVIPELDINPGFIDLQDCRVGKKKVVQLTLLNNLQNDIVIEKIESDLKNLSFKYDQNIIKPHKQIEVEVIFMPEKEVSNYKIVYIHLQGAEQPLYKIPAYIMVKGQ